MKSYFSVYLKSLIFLWSLSFFSQEKKDFTVVKELNVQGGYSIIGNNIVSNDPVKPYNVKGYHAQKNDRLSMVYVDVDGDPSTFSSSTATLELPPNAESIEQALLYWAATYPYEKGGIKKGDNEYIYVEKQGREKTFNEVLLKTPESTYLKINGDVLKDYKDSIGRPYLCRADVTSVLKQAKTVSGPYTVANIRASQGHILGGSAGGWLLFTIYKNSTEPQKTITLYDGLQFVDKEFYRVPLPLKNEKNEAKVTLSLGVLEGDERLKTDEVSVASTHKKFPLFSKNRKQNNYFNSSITHYGAMVENRNPSSQNTLGFDIATVDITEKIAFLKEKDNENIALHFNAERDQLMLFFMALAEEIEEEQYTAVPETTKTVKKDIASIDSLSEEPTEIKVSKSMKIKDIPLGYYLITNVFSESAFAEKWKAYLTEEGYAAHSFIHPENKWEYVYVAYCKTIAGCYPMYRSLMDKSEFQEVWILEVVE